MYFFTMSFASVCAVTQKKPCRKGFAAWESGSGSQHGVHGGHSVCHAGSGDPPPAEHNARIRLPCCNLKKKIRICIFIVYVHIEFCEKLLFFVGCPKKTKKKLRKKAYFNIDF
jgi:hypothetical protein